MNCFSPYTVSTGSAQNSMEVFLKCPVQVYQSCEVLISATVGNEAFADTWIDLPQRTPELKRTKYV